MPIAFVSKELLDAYSEISTSTQSKKSLFPAHSFEASCLRVGITLNDLKERTYVSIMKVLFSFLDTKEKEIREATQQDIDKFMS